MASVITMNNKTYVISSGRVYISDGSTASYVSYNGNETLNGKPLSSYPNEEATPEFLASVGLKGNITITSSSSSASNEMDKAFNKSMKKLDKAMSRMDKAFKKMFG